MGDEHGGAYLDRDKEEGEVTLGLLVLLLVVERVASESNKVGVHFAVEMSTKRVARVKAKNKLGYFDHTPFTTSGHI